MRRSLELTIILVAATLIAAAGSHFLATWVGIQTVAGQPYSVGKPNGNPPAFLAGSSLAGYGISWDEISGKLDTEIKGWGVPGGSPFEWEQFQGKASDAKTTFIVVSAYDLDEAIVCDFRADIVPLRHSIQTLFKVGGGWNEMKDTLGRYAMSSLRTLFPTLGRSRGVLGDLRLKMVQLIRPSSRAPEPEAGPKLNFGKEPVVDEYKKQKISEWSQSKMIGKISAMRAAITGNASFRGAKRMAFERMIRNAVHQGRTFVIVLPVSKTYAREFILETGFGEFEKSLVETQRSAAGAHWIRLDQRAGLSANEYFCDLVHMNIFGQEVATKLLLEWINEARHQS